MADVRAQDGIDQRLLEIIPNLSRWAAEKGRIRRFWLYGSRMKGTQESESSDLDIAVEIDLLTTEDQKEEFLERTLPAWKSELSNLVQDHLPIAEAHLEVYGGVDRDVTQYVNACSMLLFERAL